MVASTTNKHTLHYEGKGDDRKAFCSCGRWQLFHFRGTAKGDFELHKQNAEARERYTYGVN